MGAGSMVPPLGTGQLSLQGGGIPCRGGEGTPQGPSRPCPQGPHCLHSGSARDAACPWLPRDPHSFFLLGLQRYKVGRDVSSPETCQSLGCPGQPAPEPKTQGLAGAQAPALIASK